MSDYATALPSSIMAGDTVEWVEAVDSGKGPNDGFTLTVTVINADAKKTVTSDTAEGDAFLVDLGDTSAWVAGEYRAYVTTSDGTDRYPVMSSVLMIRPDLLAAGTTTYDSRSTVQLIYEALLATTQGRASNDQLSMSINGRAISRMSMEELILAEKHFRQLYKDEQRKDNLDNTGENLAGTIHTRFIG